MRESGYYYAKKYGIDKFQIALYHADRDRWSFFGDVGTTIPEWLEEVGERIPDNETLKKLNHGTQ